MLNHCPRKLFQLCITVVFLFFLHSKTVFAVPCGNGVCQISQNENCNTCPADCGACSTPTPTTTPSPTANPTSTPTIAPTDTPDPGGGGTPTQSPTPNPDNGGPDSSSSSSFTSSTPHTPPTISINSRPSSPTNQTAFTVAGTASSDGSTITTVEYSLNSGSTWNNASPIDGSFNSSSENYTFSVVNLTDGSYTVYARSKDVAGSYSGNASFTITIVSKPPEINFDSINGPTSEPKPTISGNFSSTPATIIRVEYSLDGGQSWTPLVFTQRGFSQKLPKLEDGNYPLRIRLYDNAGNINITDPEVLIIDTIPPIIGGGLHTFGPQVLIPKLGNFISVAAGAESLLALSMKGGVTEAVINTDGESFKLQKQPNSNLWYGNIKFDSKGEKRLVVSAIDGAGNKSERFVESIKVESFGKVLSKNTNKGIKGATVSLYYFQSTINEWLLWDAKSYGQENNQITGDSGEYSYMVPAGKYYLEAKAPGFKTVQSEILNVDNTAIFNFEFQLNQKPSLKINLPFIGEKTLSLPTIIPDTVTVDISTQNKNEETGEFLEVGTNAPNFVLKNVLNEDVSLSYFKGKNLLLSFFALWSSPSLEQTSILSDTTSELSDNEEIVGIALQESVEVTNTFMKRGNYKFTALADENGDTALDYKISLLPQHFFIDKQGIVREVYIGVLDKDTILEKMKNL